MYTENEATQAGRAVLMLRELVLKGQFLPGEHISEPQLVARLGVSRTPVREALSRLAHEGLLYTTGTGRYRVSEFTMNDVRDAIELRGVMEGTAARLAAERLMKAEELQSIHGPRRCSWSECATRAKTVRWQNVCPSVSRSTISSI